MAYFDIQLLNSKNGFEYFVVDRRSKQVVSKGYREKHEAARQASIKEMAAEIIVKTGGR